MLIRTGQILVVPSRWLLENRLPGGSALASIDYSLCVYIETMINDARMPSGRRFYARSLLGMLRFNHASSRCA